MKQLLDIVNFNADASCLSSEDWLVALKGGGDSLFCKWLNLFVNNNKKVILGLTGATVADLYYFNNEAIEIINTNPKIFEIILRSFSHDVSLLRSSKGFKENFLKGHEIISNEFNNVQPYYLPTEFMITNEQVSYISEYGIKGVFINSNRFNVDSANKIPLNTYLIRGIFNKKLICIPIVGNLTNYYLNAIHLWNNDEWNKFILNSKERFLSSWRDGESWLFVPDGIERENHWLEQEDNNIKRIFISDLANNELFFNNNIIKNDKLNSYPIHSFSAWLRGLRMLGFLHRVELIEDQFDKLNIEEIILWLQVINSDILSAVEKKSPIVKIKKKKNSTSLIDWIIHRANRGFEGEEFLAILENLKMNSSKENYKNNNNQPHIAKLRARLQYFHK